MADEVSETHMRIYGGTKSFSRTLMVATNVSSQTSSPMLEGMSSD